MNNAINLQEINQEQALHLTKFFCQSHGNVFLFGRSGVGKSEIAIQSAKECGFKINYLNLSVMERNDLLGYPRMNDPGDVITFKSPYYLPKLLHNTKADTVLLFDEIDKVQPEITAPLLEILLFKTINGAPINAVACILTGNLSNERAFSQEISSALLDRGSKYILNFDFYQWIEWAKAHDVHDLILGFLKSNPEFACGKLEDSTYASPSPRGWTLASRGLLKAQELKLTDIDTATQIVSGYVGNEAGLRFRIWFEYYRKFEPYVKSMIERGNMSLDFAGLVPTEQLVFSIASCYYAKQKMLAEKSKKRFLYLERLCQFFVNYRVATEVQIMGLHSSFSFDQITEHKLYECKPFFDLFTKLSEGVSFGK
jgi:ATPase family protein associated with various cellular activities (AAA)